MTCFSLSYSTRLTVFQRMRKIVVGGWLQKRYKVGQGRLRFAGPKVLLKGESILNIISHKRSYISNTSVIKDLYLLL